MDENKLLECEDNSLFSGMRQGLSINQLWMHTRLYIVFIFSHLQTKMLLFFLLPFSQSFLGCHVTFCLGSIDAVCYWPVSFERALVSTATGNGGTASLVSETAPSLLHSSEPVSLWHAASSAGYGGSGSMRARHSDTQTATELSRSSSSLSSPFHQAAGHRDH